METDTSILEILFVCTHTHTEAEQNLEEKTQFKELYEAKIKIVEERDELVMQAEEERVR